MPCLIDAKTQRCLIPNLRIARTFWARGIGLLGTHSLGMDEGLLILNCASIHTCLMRFAIDVIFVDDSFCVQKMVRELSPWRMAWGVRGGHVIELASGNIDQQHIRLHDILHYQE